MPEGDTIFRAAQALDAALAGAVVTRFESVYPRLLRIHEDTPITGRRVERIEPRGKHLLMRFSGDLVLRTHMRMHGSWHLYRPGECWRRSPSAMRVLVGTADVVAVAFDVQDAQFVADRALARDTPLGRLGPDLLATDFDVGEAIARAAARTGHPVGEVLLDQRVMAGVGNVFKSEVLFVAGVSPFAPVETLDAGRLRAVVDTARALLRANVGLGPDAASLWSGGLRRTTRRLNPGERLWVYGRAGRPCRRCGTAIECRAQGEDARLTYWCPRCQS